MHPVEALHGDLGMLAHGDVVIALSASGETDEILQLLATIKRLRLPLIAITCANSGATIQHRRSHRKRVRNPRWLRRRKFF